MPNSNPTNRNVELWELELADDPLYQIASSWEKPSFSPFPKEKYIRLIYINIRHDDSWEVFKARVDEALEGETYLRSEIEMQADEYNYDFSVRLYRLETDEEVQTRIANIRTSMESRRDARRRQYEELRAEFEGQGNAE